MAGKNPTGGGRARGPSPDPKDKKAERTVLAFLIDKHSERLTILGLSKALNKGGEFDSEDAVERASTLRGYRRSLTERVLPALGSRRLNAVTTLDLQTLVDDWLAEGQAPSTIRNSLKPLQAIYRRARSREGVAMNPTHDLELPMPDPGEVEIVASEAAARLLDALPAEDRPTWATALYAGLRYGELRALRWRAVDLDGGTIRVRESWDPLEGSIAPKTRTSQRTTPVPGVLRESRHRRAPTSAPGAPHLCLVHDRRGRECQGPLGLHGPFLDQGHV